MLCSKRSKRKKVALKTTHKQTFINTSCMYILEYRIGSIFYCTGILLLIPFFYVRVIIFLYCYFKFDTSVALYRVNFLFFWFFHYFIFIFKSLINPE